MKTLIALIAGLALAVAGIVLAPSGERAGPRPIAHGSDACAGCRMHVDRPGFAAEREAGGAVTVFDDVGCLQRVLAAGGERGRIWIEDHATGELVALEDATLVRSGGTRTPMGSGIVGFRDRAQAERHRARTGGEFVTIDPKEVRS